MRLVIILITIGMLSSCTGNGPANSETESAASEVVERHLDLGIGYLRQGDYQRAKDKLNRALEIEPRNASVHGTFGLLFQLEGELQLAERYFRNAVRYDPDSARVRNLYGAFLFAERRFPEAIEQLTRASENRFYPNRPSVFENLGVAYLRVGDAISAEHAFTRAVQLNPEQPRALLELAAIRYDERNHVEARQLYRRHISVAPKSPKTLLLCIRLARVFQDADEEASCAEALEGIYPSSPEYREYQGSS